MRISRMQQSFSQKSDAKRHYLNVHKGRKYSCPQCSKMFSSREMVKAHCQNVHEKKRWSCTQCEKVFRWHCNFVKHNCRGKPIVKKYKCPFALSRTLTLLVFPDTRECAIMTANTLKMIMT